MKQSQKKQKCFGEAGFNQYYTELFGSRWTDLKAALQTEPDYLTWKAGGEEPYYLDSGSVRAALT